MRCKPNIFKQAKQGQSQAKKIFDILSLIFALYIYKLIIPKYKAKKIFDF